MLEPWRRVFRHGIAPQLPLEALEALRQGLVRFDPRLRPGGTVGSGPWAPVSTACAIGFAGWKGLALATPEAIEDFFNEVCARADVILEQPGACRHFIRWFDESRREFAFPLLLAEVNRAIAERTEQPVDEPGTVPCEISLS
jgi:hypothetical protein